VPIFDIIFDMDVDEVLCELVLWNCLQCSDVVGWAAGRASGLL